MCAILCYFMSKHHFLLNQDGESVSTILNWIPYASGILGDIVSKTVATLGALEGGARHEVVGGIGPKGRSFGDYIP